MSLVQKRTLAKVSLEQKMILIKVSFVKSLYPSLYHCKTDTHAKTSRLQKRHPYKSVISVFHMCFKSLYFVKFCFVKCCLTVFGINNSFSLLHFRLYYENRYIYNRSFCDNTTQKQSCCNFNNSQIQC